jgi:hypothetical protein
VRPRSGYAGKRRHAAFIITRINGDEPPPEPRRFVFDRPFLIYLQQRQAKQPYFVMWVENPEVLVPDAAKTSERRIRQSGPT